MFSMPKVGADPFIEIQSEKQQIPFLNDLKKGSTIVERR